MCPVWGSPVPEKHLYWSEPNKVSTNWFGPEVYKELWGLYVFNLKKVNGRHYCNFSYFMGGLGKYKARHFLQVHLKINGDKLKHGKFQADMKETFFIRVIKLWNRLPTEAVANLGDSQNLLGEVTEQFQLN